MTTQHTPELYDRSAQFYDNAPTGQYDEQAAHALRCHHNLLEALKDLKDCVLLLAKPGNNFHAKYVENAEAAIAKATNQPTAN